jgi:hypothetical protein
MSNLCFLLNDWLKHINARWLHSHLQLVSIDRLVSFVGKALDERFHHYASRKLTSCFDIILLVDDLDIIIISLHILLLLLEDVVEIKLATLRGGTAPGISRCVLGLPPPWLSSVGLRCAHILALVIIFFIGLQNLWRVF